MAEVLTSFANPVRDESGVYYARAVGRLAADHMWEGWVEFVPVDGSDVLASGIESRQPEHEHLVYWATGLTHVYLEGSLARARKPVTVRVRVNQKPEPILNPFAIGERSLDVLRQELTALNRQRLVNIIAAYGLAREADVAPMSETQLAAMIVAAVESRLATGLR